MKRFSFVAASFLVASLGACTHAPAQPDDAEPDTPFLIARYGYGFAGSWTANFYETGEVTLGERDLQEERPYRTIGRRDVARLKALLERHDLRSIEPFYAQGISDADWFSLRRVRDGKAEGAEMYHPARARTRGEKVARRRFFAIWREVLEFTPPPLHKDHERRLWAR